MAMRNATLLALALLSIGCKDDSPSGGSPQEGLTSVLLTDAPFPYDSVARVELYFVSVAASALTDTGGTSGAQDWVTIATPRRRFDLLELQRGTTALMGESDLSAGSYEAVRVTVNVDSSRLVDVHGNLVAVRWQRTGEVVLNALVQSALQVPDSGADIVLDFDVGRTFVPVDSTSSQMEFWFIPWFRAVVASATGSIAGEARGDPDGTGERGVRSAIEVFRGDPAKHPGTWFLWASGVSDAEGRYRIAFLSPDTYIVRATPLGGVDLQAATVTNVTVETGAETALPIALEPPATR